MTMNPDWLLKHFEQISEAPDAVPRLRRFILDLAVRGKLVEQDPEDEPASELLKRIEAEMRSLAGTGEIKIQNWLPMPNEDAVDFRHPTGWKLVPLGKVAVCLDYRRIPINNEERAKRIEGKVTEELFPYYGATQQQGWIDDFIFDEELVLLGEDGVPFFEPLRPKAYVISGKTWVNNHAHVFRGVLTSNRFLAHWLNVFDYSGRVAGATRSKLNQSKAIDIPTPLPPLAEQQRIVAKVDELMALCDELEAMQAKRERRRDRLVAATLHGLNNGDDDSEPGGHPTFEESARFYFNHLPRLTARPEHIHQLRQTILNLAVRGKLVPQDPNDEPASELVKRIRAKKQKLIRGRSGIKGKSLIMAEDKTPFKIPKTWVWVESTEPAVLISDKGKKLQTKDVLESGEFPVVDQGKVFIRGYCNDVQKVIRISEPIIVFGDHTRETKLIDFDFVVGADGVKLLNPIEIDPAYYFLALQWVPLDSRGYARHFKLLRASRFPLPPLAEQHQIVAKVDELMALCDKLETRLTTTATTRRQLLEATLSEAIAS
jgi:type I restriction enzyme S subunit